MFVKAFKGGKVDFWLFCSIGVHIALLEETVFKVKDFPGGKNGSY